MSIYSQNVAERDSSVYSKGYGRPIYEDRPEWTASSYNRREFGNRDERGSDFRFSRSRWGERDNYRNEMSPSPKRRRLRDDLDQNNSYHKGKRIAGVNPPSSTSGGIPPTSSPYEYRPASSSNPTSNYYADSNYRSTSAYDGDSAYPRREYEYDRDPSNRETRYDRDRDRSYEWYSPRRNERTRSSMLINSFRADSETSLSNSYGYSDNLYERESSYLSRNYGDREKERGSRLEMRNDPNWNQGTQNQNYSPTQSSESDSESEDEEQDRKPSNSNQSNGPEDSTTEQSLDAESSTPTPKKRLGWGKGLVAFEKAKEEPSPTLGSDPRPPPIQEEPNSEEIVSEDQKIQSENPPATNVVEEDKQQNLVQEEEQKATNLDQPASVIKAEEVKVEPIKEVKEPSQTKEEIVQLLEKLDSEIIKTEQIIQNLKKPKKVEQKHIRTTHHSTVQSIYEENKQRVALILEENPIFALPPSKPANKNSGTFFIYRKNIVKSLIRNRVIECIEKERELTNEYIKSHETWKKTMIQMESKREKKEERKRSQAPNNLPAARVQDDDMQSLFHRRPVLRSTNARNILSNSNGGLITPTRSSNRFGNGDSVKSEAEFEEIMNQLREVEGEQHDPFHRYRSTVARIPNMILEEQNLPLFVNSNGIIEDPMVIEREKKFANPWTEEERTIFVEYFLKFPKEFGEISARLQKKSTKDVVYFYYTNKKTLELKKLLREHQNKKKPGRGRYNPRDLPPLLTSLSSPQIDSNNRTPKPRSTANSALASATALFQSREDELPTPIRRSTSQNNIEPVGTNEETKKEKEKRVFWTDKEKSIFLKSLKTNGKNWKKIAVEIPTKTPSQVKNYFQNYKNKLNLHLVLPENDVMPSGGKKKTRRFANEENKRRQSKNEEDEDEDSSSSDEDNQDVVSPESTNKYEAETTNNAMETKEPVETKPKLIKEIVAADSLAEMIILNEQSLDPKDEPVRENDVQEQVEVQAQESVMTEVENVVNEAPGSVSNTTEQPEIISEEVPVVLQSIEEPVAQVSTEEYLAKDEIKEERIEEMVGQSKEELREETNEEAREDPNNFSTTDSRMEEEPVLSDPPLVTKESTEDIEHPLMNAESPSLTTNEVRHESEIIIPLPESME
eukprot:TRINITY_DN5978_c0_g3_i1.p1 TRINITY_DN5978_c0_g3~~TRINITY_DN5978_c0_g3_i1.p1  ORF type:complete len:1130 (-),score=362.84 TRINITY_DN5978_c0_g3_i1:39-3428(-)